jgi:hypothetical protein
MVDVHGSKWVFLAGYRVCARARMDDLETKPNSARLKLSMAADLVSPPFKVVSTGLDCSSIRLPPAIIH